MSTEDLNDLILDVLRDRASFTYQSAIATDLRKRGITISLPSVGRALKVLAAERRVTLGTSPKLAYPLYAAAGVKLTDEVDRRAFDTLSEAVACASPDTAFESPEDAQRAFVQAFVDAGLLEYRLRVDLSMGLYRTALPFAPLTMPKTSSGGVTAFHLPADYVLPELPQPEPRKPKERKPKAPVVKTNPVPLTLPDIESRFKPGASFTYRKLASAFGVKLNFGHKVALGRALEAAGYTRRRNKNGAGPVVYVRP